MARVKKELNMTFQQPNNKADLVIVFIVFILGGVAIYGGHSIFGLILWSLCAFSVFSILLESIGIGNRRG